MKPLNKPEDEAKLEELMDFIWDHSDYEGMSHSAVKQALRDAIDYGRETARTP